MGARAGAALALLWGGETVLYERLGFELCGVQTRVPAGELELGEPIRDFSSIKLGRGWIPSLMTPLRMRGSGLRLAESDERWIEAHRGVDWYWLGEPEAPQAYAAIGRGIDLQGVVHEWGGESSDALKTLLQLVRMEHSEAQLLASPGLLAAWGLGAQGAPTEFLCMARALDVPKLVAGFRTQAACPRSFSHDPQRGRVPKLLFGPEPKAASPLWIWALRCGLDLGPRHRFEHAFGWSCF